MASAWGRASRVVVLLLADDPAAEVDQDLGDVDLHRADVVAGPAERRGVGERAGVLDAREHRRQDRADRAGVDRVVGVAAGPLVDRADVQAGAAADAVRAWRPDRVFEDLGPAVVEEDRGGTPAGRRRGHAGPERVVRVHPLGRSTIGAGAAG